MSISYGSANTTGSMMGLPVGLLLKHIRREADEAERKAQELTQQADKLCEEHGITPEIEASYQIHEDELAPVDPLTGKPKYKGRKRGRKPKPRLRKHDKSKGKRKHTAYTLFVKENYPPIREMHPEYPSKHIISIVARQWASIGKAEKLVWKERAAETHHAVEDEELVVDDNGAGTQEESIPTEGDQNHANESDGEDQVEHTAPQDEHAQNPLSKSPASKRLKRTRPIRNARKG